MHAYPTPRSLITAGREGHNSDVDLSSLPDRPTKSRLLEKLGPAKEIE